MCESTYFHFSFSICIIIPAHGNLGCQEKREAKKKREIEQCLQGVFLLFYFPNLSVSSLCLYKDTSDLHVHHTAHLNTHSKAVVSGATELCLKPDVSWQNWSHFSCISALLSRRVCYCHASPGKTYSLTVLQIQSSKYLDRKIYLHPFNLNTFSFFFLSSFFLPSFCAF